MSSAPQRRTVSIAAEAAPAPEPKGAERRRHRRVEVPAVAVVTIGGKTAGLLNVADVSLGGAALLGEAAVVPGQRLELLLQVPSCPPVALKAKALRRQVSGPHGRRSAVVFDPLNAQQSAALGAAMEAGARAATVKGKPGTVLVAGGLPGLRAGLEAELRALGHRPLFAPTALEAAAYLRVRGHELVAALVDEPITKAKDWDLLQLLREHHPRMKRIVMAEATGSFRLNIMLRSGLAEAMVERPYTAAALAHPLGPGPDAKAAARAAAATTHG